MFGVVFRIGGEDEGDRNMFVPGKTQLTFGVLGKTAELGRFWNCNWDRVGCVCERD